MTYPNILEILRGKMWYLLVAAGAGYLTHRWQNAHKSRFLFPGNFKNQRSSPPTVNDSNAVQNANTHSNGSIEDERNCKAPLYCFVSGSAEGNIPCQQVSKLPSGSPRGDSSSPQVLESNKRSACEAFLVPVPYAFKSIEGNTEGQFIFDPLPGLDFTNIKRNIKDQFVSNSRLSCLEFYNVQRSAKHSSGFTSKPNLGFAKNQGNVKEQVAFTTKPNLDFVNRGNEEKLEGDSTSPSSSCSSTSTIFNSTIGSSPNHLEFPHDNVMPDDRSTLRPFVFIGENQKTTDLFNNEFMCNHKGNWKMKPDTLSIASDTNFPRKVRSLSSPGHTVAESEWLVRFGLAMAVFFMVSSSKREMEKMGNVLLKEMEDFSSDMRKKLQDGRACVSSQTLSDNECKGEIPTIKSKDAVAQVYTIEKTEIHFDGLSDDDESLRSVITEEHAQYELHVCDLKAGHEEKLQFVKTSLGGYWDDGKQNEDCDSEDEKDWSTLGKTVKDDNVLSVLELERKLWRISQQRQDEKILELEGSLEMALSELHAKEEELRWWKNRAWRMEHSFGSTSGAISIKDPVERVEDFNHIDELRFSIKGRSDAGDENTKGFSTGEMTSFLALEEEFIEILGNKNVHQNEMVREGSS